MVICVRITIGLHYVYIVLTLALSTTGGLSLPLIARRILGATGWLFLGSLATLSLVDLEAFVTVCQDS